ncbi:MAG: AAA family ATPase [Proteobacteria bacterium]|nr:AAA family ATPase [Pseudomonadota bacterium]
MMTPKLRPSNRLHPRGALRARFQPPLDDVFRRLGVGAKKLDLGDEGLYLAEELVAADRWLGGGDSEVLGVLVLALMIAQSQGSTRLPLDPRGELRTLVIDIARVAGMDLDLPRTLRAITALTSSPRFNSVIGVGDARLPLIVDDHALYTERSRWLEVRVAARLAARLAAPRVDVDVAIDPSLSPEQARAVRIALGGKVAVVTGGPGTGKTVVAAAIIRGFLQLGVAHVALAAQTGKAANRLTEVIAAQLGPGVAAPPVAQTLHRLLDARGHNFGHHAQAPLPVGAVIVDEASMIDLELMDALLDAMPASAPLVLVGDRHQLPAIDAGQILADLVDLDPTSGRSVAVLAHSYRMDAGNPRGAAILAAAAAVNTGAMPRLFGTGALATPRTIPKLAFAGVEWVDTTARDAVTGVADAMWHHFGGPRAIALAEHVVRFVDGRCLDDDRLEELWKLLGRARLLAVTRGLPTGSVALNAHLHGRAIARVSVTKHPDFVPGEPVMVTRNDHQRGLFNGDQGVIVRADEGLGAHHYRAVFKIGGRFAVFSIEALRDRLELAWAITVHKSQGSEMDAVALILPHDDLPLVTRELIYTGMTRARESVVLAGPRTILVAGGKRGVHRYSGLAARIARAKVAE